MATTYKINNIDLYDVKDSSFQVKVERNLLSNDPVLIPDINLTLIGSQYNPDEPSGFFYGLGVDLFKDVIFTITDTDVNVDIDCTIKNINYDSKSNLCKVTLHPFISQKLENTIQYVQDNYTPAKGLKEILQLNGLNDNIDFTSFNNADYNQTAANMLCNFTITTDNNRKILDIINTISLITGSDIFIGMDNKIYFLQYNRYFNPVPYVDIGQNIIIDYVIRKNANDLINQFNLQTMYGGYLNESNVGKSSRDIFGEVTKDINFGNNQEIVTNSLSAMIWAGENWVYRNQYPKWIIELECVDNLSYPLTLMDFFTVSWLNNHNYEIISIVKQLTQGKLIITGASYE
jgi:hypothetical protein